MRLPTDEERETYNEREYDIEQSACFDCVDSEACLFAFDLYCFDGECLANK